MSWVWTNNELSILVSDKSSTFSLQNKENLRFIFLENVANTKKNNKLIQNTVFEAQWIKNTRIRATEDLCDSSISTNSTLSYHEHGAPFRKVKNITFTETLQHSLNWPSNYTLSVVGT